MTDAAVQRRHVLIIANPAAGRRSAARNLDRIVAILQQRGCIVALRRAGAENGGVEQLARDAEADFDVVVAAGGDGTINAVVNGLNADTARPIALLPFGTANVLAHDLGLPWHVDALADMITNGPVRAVWPGKVGNRVFLAMASSGFDAETVAAVNPRLKRCFGRLAFAWAILTRWPRYRTRELTVRAGGVDHRATNVIATIGPFYAGRYVIAPHADLAEPVLDLLLFLRSGRIAVLRYRPAAGSDSATERHRFSASTGSVRIRRQTAPDTGRRGGGRRASHRAAGCRAANIPGALLSRKPDCGICATLSDWWQWRRVSTLWFAAAAL